MCFGTVLNLLFSSHSRSKEKTVNIPLPAIPRLINPQRPVIEREIRTRPNRELPPIRLNTLIATLKPVVPHVSPHAADHHILQAAPCEDAVGVVQDVEDELRAVDGRGCAGGVVGQVLEVVHVLQGEGRGVGAGGAG